MDETQYPKFYDFLKIVVSGLITGVIVAVISVQVRDSSTENRDLKQSVRSLERSVTSIDKQIEYLRNTYSNLADKSTLEYKTKFLEYRIKKLEKKTEKQQGNINNNYKLIRELQTQSTGAKYGLFEYSTAWEWSEHFLAFYQPKKPQH